MADDLERAADRPLPAGTPPDPAHQRLLARRRIPTQLDQVGDQAPLAGIGGGLAAASTLTDGVHSGSSQS